MDRCIRKEGQNIEVKERKKEENIEKGEKMARGSGPNPGECDEYMGKQAGRKEGEKEMVTYGLQPPLGNRQYGSIKSEGRATFAD